MPVIANEETEDFAEIQQAVLDHEQAQRHRDNLGGDSEFSEMLEALAQEVPEVKPHFAEAILDVLTDRGWLRASARRGLAKEVAIITRTAKILRYIKSHPTPNAIFAALYVHNDELLDDINSNLTQTQFADLMYPHKSVNPLKPEVNPAKAAVNNAVKDAQKWFKLPPRPDQRSAKACATMSNKTIQRLEKQ